MTFCPKCVIYIKMAFEEVCRIQKVKFGTESLGSTMQSIQNHKNPMKSRFALGGFVLLLFIVLCGCGGGGYRDEALLGQAKRSLIRIKNSLEQFRIENGCYPGNGADLREKLSPFIVEEEWNQMVSNSFSEGPSYVTPDSLTSYLIEVKATDRLKTPLVIRGMVSPEKDVEENK